MLPAQHLRQIYNILAWTDSGYHMISRLQGAILGLLHTPDFEASAAEAVFSGPFGCQSPTCQHH
jgi:hypothetical protein